MGSITRSFANFIGAGGVLNSSALTNAITDLNPVKADLSVLALKESVQNNRSGRHLINQWIEQFEDDNYIENETSVTRNVSEYISSGDTTPTADSGATATDIGDGNTWWSSTGAFRDSYGDGNELTMDGGSYNYCFWSKSDGADASASVGSGDALLTGNFRLRHDSISYDFGSTLTSTTASDYYCFGVASGLTGQPQNNNPIEFDSGAGMTGVFATFAGAGRDIRIVHHNSGTKTLLTTINGSEWVTNGDELAFVRSGSTLYFQINGVTKYTIGSSYFNTTGNCWFAFGYGRGSNGNAETFTNCKYTSGLTDVKGIGGGLAASGSFTSTDLTPTDNGSKSELGIIVLYEDDVGTATLNTDLVADLSADGGSNYSTATLVSRGNFDSTTKIAIATGVSVTAGSTLKYKVSLANQSDGVKQTRIKGVSLLY